MMYSNQPTKEELAETAKKEQADKEAKTPKSVTVTSTQLVQKLILLVKFHKKLYLN